MRAVSAKVVKRVRAWIGVIQTKEMEMSDNSLDWLERARTWAQFLALLAKDGGGPLTQTPCVDIARLLNEAQPPVDTSRVNAADRRN